MLNGDMLRLFTAYLLSTGIRTHVYHDQCFAIHLASCT